MWRNRHLLKIWKFYKDFTRVAKMGKDCKLKKLTNDRFKVSFFNQS